MKTIRLPFYILIPMFLYFPLLSKTRSFLPKRVSPTQSLLVLPLHGSISISLTPNDSIFLQRKNLLHIQDDRKSLFVRAKALGSTQLHIGTQTYKVVILDDLEYKNYLRLLEILENMPTLYLDDYQDLKWIIGGRLDHSSTWLSLAHQNFNSLQNQFEVTPEQLKIIEYEINKTLKMESLHTIKIRLEPFPKVRLSPTDFKNRRLKEILQYFGINFEEDSKLLSTESLVRVHVLLAEVRKSAAESLGVEWASNIMIKSLPKNSMPMESSPSALVKFLSTQGKGKVLANPILLTKSGSEANFFAGGEFPIRIKTHQTYSISWRKYGISLKIKPLADTEGRLSLDLNSEISSIDSGQSLDGIPALFTNSISSQFDLQNSQMIALSGLTKKINGEAIKEWPGLGSIPILGSLFSSKDFIEDQTELVVFVTPIIVPPEE